MKNVPASSSRITASRCAALARAGAVVTTTSRNSNAGWRKSHAKRAGDQRASRDEREAGGDRRSAVSGHPTCAPRRIATQSSGNEMPASFAAIGTSECPVMPGDVLTSRNEYEPSARRIRSSRPQPVQPTMSNAASDAAWISRSTACRQSARAEVLRFVREILGVVVVVAVRCFDPDQRQRAPRENRRRSARSRPRIPRPARGRRASPLRRRRARARRDRPSSTLVMPIVEPSRAGFTISGSPSSATTRIQSVAAVTTR